MKKVHINFSLNGKEYEVLVEPNKTLIQMIREDFRLTGTKHGCGVGDCGSCTVLVNGDPINSCLALAASVDGCEVVTIEGLADGKELHPIQASFVEKGAIQCGFCSPGMILSSKALLETNPNPTEADIRQALSGNLCRCTGYQKIVEAVADSAQKIQEGSK